MGMSQILNSTSNILINVLYTVAIKSLHIPDKSTGFCDLKKIKLRLIMPDLYLPLM